MYINIIHHKNNSLQNSIKNLAFKVHIQISKFVTCIIWSQTYSIHSNSPLFVGIFKIIDYIKFKANQIYLKQVKIIQDVMSIHYQKI